MPTALDRPTRTVTSTRNMSSVRVPYRYGPRSRSRFRSILTFTSSTRGCTRAAASIARSREAAFFRVSGVMEASAKGAKRGGGFTVGILPTGNKADANHHIDLPIATAMSTARNLIIVRTADAIVAVNGSYGTLSEMAHAFDLGKTVFALRTWPMDKAGVEPSLFVPVDTPREAVERALAYARKSMDAEKPGPGFVK